MKCPACNVETGKQVASYFCPHCGAPLTWAVRWENARKRVVRQEVREKLVLPTALPTTGATPVHLAPPTLYTSPGALLTGNVRGDFLLGVLNDPVALALLGFGTWRLLSASDNDYPMLPALGQIATGSFMLWHGAKMRERYPAIASGFKRWRGGLDKCYDHLKTLLCGAGVAVVLFPLIAFLLLFVRMFGAFGWIPVLIVVYGFGIVARRVRGDKPRRKQRLQNG